MLPFPALIFDLDGTLVDTAPDLLGALNAVLAARGRQAIAPATLRHMVGFGATSLLEQAFAATGTPAYPDEMPELAAALLAHYRLHMTDNSLPFPGVEATLAKLVAMGARLGVLTNKTQDLAVPLLDRLGLTGHFAAIYGAGRKDYIKPDARIFHDIVRDLGGGAAAMIGDSITDLKTARAAGAPCILVSYGYTPVPAAALGAELVLDHFGDLPAALTRLGGKILPETNTKVP